MIRPHPGACQYLLLIGLILLGIGLVGCASGPASWPHPFSPSDFEGRCDNGCTT